MNKENYKFLEDKYEVKISSNKLYEILPSADLFLVGQGSTTINWSILCKVPFLILDWYGHNYESNNWIKRKKLIKDESMLDDEILSLYLRTK